jgi:hypothetical protein
VLKLKKAIGYKKGETEKATEIEVAFFPLI